MSDYNVPKRSSIPQGFNALMGAIGDRRDQRAQRAEEIRKQGVRQKTAELVDQEKYKELSNHVIKNPWLKDEISKADAWTSKAIQDNAIDFSSKILSTDSIEEKQRLLGQYMVFNVKNGGNTDDSMPLAMALKNGDPEPLNKAAKGMLAVNDKQAFDRLVSDGSDGNLKDRPYNATQDYMEHRSSDNPEDQVYAEEMIKWKRMGSTEYRRKLSDKADMEAVDKAFTSLAGLGDKKRYMTETIRLIDEEGLKTGAIRGRLPTFKRASQELDNIQGNLGLNVIQNTTFGSLSQAELDFALETALPGRMKTKALRDWVVRKRNALSKLENYIGRYAAYLSDSGSKAGWLQMQRIKRHAQATNVKRDANGIITHYKYADGEIEEVN